MMFSVRKNSDSLFNSDKPVGSKKEVSGSILHKNECLIHRINGSQKIAWLIYS